MNCTKEQDKANRTKNTFEVFSSQEIEKPDQQRSQIGKVVHDLDGSAELIMSSFPTSTRVVTIDGFSPLGGSTSEVVAVFDFEGGEARFPIGFARSDGYNTHVRFSGRPVPGCKILIHEGLKGLDTSRQAAN